MTDHEILDGITEAMRTSFASPDLTVTPDSTQSDIPGWDSIATVGLVLEVERRFGISIDPMRIDEIGSVADLAALVRESVPEAV